jgi:hypothetical protein
VSMPTITTNQNFLSIVCLFMFLLEQAPLIFCHFKTYNSYSLGDIFCYIFSLLPVRYNFDMFFIITPKPHRI